MAPKFRMALRFVGVVASLAGSVMLTTGGCRNAEEVATTAVQSSEAKPPPPFALGTPETVQIAPEIVATGNLKSLAAAQLAVSIPGTLARVLVERGQRVVEGTVLLKLDDAAARAALARAEAGVAAARAQLRLAEDALARTQKLGEEGGISASQLVQAEAQRDLAAAQLGGAQAQRDEAAVHLRNHTLRAPFRGVVTLVPNGVGFAVSPAVPLVVLESTHPLALETSVTQEEARELAVGVPARVSVPATGAQAEATVRVVVPTVDPATNRVPVELTVPNEDGRFLVHAFARAYMKTGEERAAWRVPATALVQKDGAFAVWLAVEGLVHTARVRVLTQDAAQAVVDPGLPGWPAGARVVIGPPTDLREGAPLAASVAP